MDPDESPLIRFGRTFWAAVAYITTTVGRFLRAEPHPEEVQDSHPSDEEDDEEDDVSRETASQKRREEHPEKEWSGTDMAVGGWLVHHDKETNVYSVQFSKSSGEETGSEGDEPEQKSFDVKDYSKLALAAEHEENTEAVKSSVNEECEYGLQGEGERLRGERIDEPADDEHLWEYTEESEGETDDEDDKQRQEEEDERREDHKAEQIQESRVSEDECQEIIDITIHHTQQVKDRDDEAGTLASEEHDALRTELKGLEMSGDSAAGYSGIAVKSELCGSGEVDSEVRGQEDSQEEEVMDQEVMKEHSSEEDYGEREMEEHSRNDNTTAIPQHSPTAVELVIDNTVAMPQHSPTAAEGVIDNTVAKLEDSPTAAEREMEQHSRNDNATAMLQDSLTAAEGAIDNKTAGYSGIAVRSELCGSGEVDSEVRGQEDSQEEEVMDQEDHKDDPEAAQSSAIHAEQGEAVASVILAEQRAPESHASLTSKDETAPDAAHQDLYAPLSIATHTHHEQEISSEEDYEEREMEQHINTAAMLQDSSTETEPVIESLAAMPQDSPTAVEGVTDNTAEMLEDSPTAAEREMEEHSRNDNTAAILQDSSIAAEEVIDSLAAMLQDSPTAVELVIDNTAEMLQDSSTETDPVIDSLAAEMLQVSPTAAEREMEQHRSEEDYGGDFDDEVIDQEKEVEDQEVDHEDDPEAEQSSAIHAEQGEAVASIILAEQRAPESHASLTSQNETVPDAAHQDHDAPLSIATHTHHEQEIHALTHRLVEEVVASSVECVTNELKTQDHREEVHDESHTQVSAASLTCPDQVDSAHNLKEPQEPISISNQPADSLTIWYDEEAEDNTEAVKSSANEEREHGLQGEGERLRGERIDEPADHKHLWEDTKKSEGQTDDEDDKQRQEEDERREDHKAEHLEEVPEQESVSRIDQNRREEVQLQGQVTEHHASDQHLCEKEEDFVKEEMMVLESVCEEDATAEATDNKHPCEEVEQHSTEEEYGQTEMEEHSRNDNAAAMLQDSPTAAEGVIDNTAEMLQDSPTAAEGVIDNTAEMLQDSPTAAEGVIDNTAEMLQDSPTAAERTQSSAIHTEQGEAVASVILAEQRAPESHASLASQNETVPDAAHQDHDAPLSIATHTHHEQEIHALTHRLVEEVVASSVECVTNELKTQDHREEVHDVSHTQVSATSLTCPDQVDSAHNLKEPQEPISNQPAEPLTIWYDKEAEDNTEAVKSSANEEREHELQGEGERLIGERIDEPADHKHLWENTKKSEGETDDEDDKQRQEEDEKREKQKAERERTKGLEEVLEQESVSRIDQNRHKEVQLQGQGTEHHAGDQHQCEKEEDFVKEEMMVLESVCEEDATAEATDNKHPCEEVEQASTEEDYGQTEMKEHSRNDNTAEMLQDSPTEAEGVIDNTAAMLQDSPTAVEPVIDNAAEMLRDSPTAAEGVTDNTAEMLQDSPTAAGLVIDNTAEMLQDSPTAAEGVIDNTAEMLHDSPTAAEGVIDNTAEMLQDSPTAAERTQSSVIHAEQGEAVVSIVLAEQRAPESHASLTSLTSQDKTEPDAAHQDRDAPPAITTYTDHEQEIHTLTHRLVEEVVASSVECVTNELKTQDHREEVHDESHTQVSAASLTCPDQVDSAHNLKEQQEPISNQPAEPLTIWYDKEAEDNTEAVKSSANEEREHELQGEGERLRGERIDEPADHKHLWENTKKSEGETDDEDDKQRQEEDERREKQKAEREMTKGLEEVLEQESVSRIDQNRQEEVQLQGQDTEHHASDQHLCEKEEDFVKEEMMVLESVCEQDATAEATDNKHPCEEVEQHSTEEDYGQTEMEEHSRNDNTAAILQDSPTAAEGVIDNTAEMPQDSPTAAEGVIDNTAEMLQDSSTAAERTQSSAIHGEQGEAVVSIILAEQRAPESHASLTSEDEIVPDAAHQDLYAPLSIATHTHHEQEIHALTHRLVEEVVASSVECVTNELKTQDHWEEVHDESHTQVSAASLTCPDQVDSAHNQKEQQEPISNQPAEPLTIWYDGEAEDNTEAVKSSANEEREHELQGEGERLRGERIDEPVDDKHLWEDTKKSEGQTDGEDDKQRQEENERREDHKDEHLEEVLEQESVSRIDQNRQEEVQLLGQVTEHHASDQHLCEKEEDFVKEEMMVLESVCEEHGTAEATDNKHPCEEVEQTSTEEEYGQTEMEEHSRNDNATEMPQDSPTAAEGVIDNTAKMLQDSSTAAERTQSSAIHAEQGEAVVSIILAEQRAPESHASLASQNETAPDAAHQDRDAPLSIATHTDHEQEIHALTHRLVEEVVASSVECVTDELKTQDHREELHDENHTQVSATSLTCPEVDSAHNLKEQQEPISNQPAEPLTIWYDGQAEDNTEAVKSCANEERELELQGEGERLRGERIDEPADDKHLWENTKKSEGQTDDEDDRQRQEEDERREDHKAEHLEEVLEQESVSRIDQNRQEEVQLLGQVTEYHASDQHLCEKEEDFVKEEMMVLESVCEEDATAEATDNKHPCEEVEQASTEEDYGQTEMEEHSRKDNTEAMLQDSPTAVEPVIDNATIILQDSPPEATDNKHPCEEVEQTSTEEDYGQTEMEEHSRNDNTAEMLQDLPTAVEGVIDNTAAMLQDSSTAAEGVIDNTAEMLQDSSTAAEGVIDNTAAMLQDSPTAAEREMEHHSSVEEQVQDRDDKAETLDPEEHDTLRTKLNEEMMVLDSVCEEDATAEATDDKHPCEEVEQASTEEDYGKTEMKEHSRKNNTAAMLQDSPTAVELVIDNTAAMLQDSLTAAEPVTVTDTTHTISEVIKEDLLQRGPTGQSAQEMHANLQEIMDVEEDATAEATDNKHPCEEVEQTSTEEDYGQTEMEEHSRKDNTEAMLQDSPTAVEPVIDNATIILQDSPAAEGVIDNTAAMPQDSPTAAEREMEERSTEEDDGEREMEQHIKNDNTAAMLQHSPTAAELVIDNTAAMVQDSPTEAGPVIDNATEMLQDSLTAAEGVIDNTAEMLQDSSTAAEGVIDNTAAMLQDSPTAAEREMEHHSSVEKQVQDRDDKAETLDPEEHDTLRTKLNEEMMVLDSVCEEDTTAEATDNKHPCEEVEQASTEEDYGQTEMEEHSRKDNTEAMLQDSPTAVEPVIDNATIILQDSPAAEGVIDNTAAMPQDSPTAAEREMEERSTEEDDGEREMEQHIKNDNTAAMLQHSPTAAELVIDNTAAMVQDSPTEAGPVIDNATEMLQDSLTAAEGVIDNTAEMLQDSSTAAEGVIDNTAAMLQDSPTAAEREMEHHSSVEEQVQDRDDKAETLDPEEHDTLRTKLNEEMMVLDSVCEEDATAEATDNKHPCEEVEQASTEEDYGQTEMEEHSRKDNTEAMLQDSPTAAEPVIDNATTMLQDSPAAEGVIDNTAAMPQDSPTAVEPVIDNATIILQDSPAAEGVIDNTAAMPQDSPTAAEREMEERSTEEDDGEREMEQHIKNDNIAAMPQHSPTADELVIDNTAAMVQDSPTEAGPVIDNATEMLQDSLTAVEPVIDNAREMLQHSLTAVEPVIDNATEMLQDSLTAVEQVTVTDTTHTISEVIEEDLLQRGPTGQSAQEMNGNPEEMMDVVSEVTDITMDAGAEEPRGEKAEPLREERVGKEEEEEEEEEEVVVEVAEEEEEEEEEVVVEVAEEEEEEDVVVDVAEEEEEEEEEVVVEVAEEEEEEEEVVVDVAEEEEEEEEDVVVEVAEEEEEEEEVVVDVAEEEEEEEEDVVVEVAEEEEEEEVVVDVAEEEEEEEEVVVEVAEEEEEEEEESADEVVVEEEEEEEEEERDEFEGLIATEESEDEGVSVDPEDSEVQEAHEGWQSEEGEIDSIEDFTEASEALLYEMPELERVEPGTGASLLREDANPASTEADASLTSRPKHTAPGTPWESQPALQESEIAAGSGYTENGHTSDILRNTHDDDVTADTEFVRDTPGTALPCGAPKEMNLMDISESKPESGSKHRQQVEAELKIKMQLCKESKSLEEGSELEIKGSTTTVLTDLSVKEELMESDVTETAVSEESQMIKEEETTGAPHEQADTDISWTTGQQIFAAETEASPDIAGQHEEPDVDMATIEVSGGEASHLDDRSALKRKLEDAGVQEEAAEDELDVTAEPQLSSLDFSVQKSRIKVKNPLVRPPKDPRTLLHLPSLEPTPRAPQLEALPGHSDRKPSALRVPRAGLGVMGVRLPGLGAGFPVLRKTNRGPKEEEKSESSPSQKSETEQKQTEDVAEAGPTQSKPKWKPPKHAVGMGNPFMMAELKGKLRKPPKE